MGSSSSKKRKHEGLMASLDCTMLGRTYEGGVLRKQEGLVRYRGGCHCGAVRFEVWSAPDLHVFNCNICIKKQNRHFIVPKSQFTLLQGSENITTYTFNTHTAKHTFCKTCGVQSFYTPRSNPDGFGVAPHCLDPGTINSVTVEDFCGENWEESMQKHKRKVGNMFK